MKRIPFAMILPFTLLLVACDVGNPASPDDPLEQGSTKNVNLSAKIQGFVWLDENFDGIWDEGEPRVPNASVELVEGSEDDPFGVSTITNQDGTYSYLAEVGKDYFLVFKLPDEYELMAFTRQGAGEDKLDSDVNARGETEWFTLTEDFSRVLSAGAIVVDPKPTPVSRIIEDDVDDCRKPGQDETQPCPADIKSCSVEAASEGTGLRYICHVDLILEESEFDFYVTLNSDGDGATGKNEGLREGVDFELFGNGLEGQVYLNHYAADGQFIKSDLLQSTVASLTFAQDEIEGDIIQLDLTSVAALELPLDEKSAISFVVLHFPPDGAQLYDETPQMTDVFQNPE